MEIKWDEIKLSPEVTESEEFLRYVNQSLNQVIPTEVNSDFAKVYDTWHRHLIPLEYFFKYLLDSK